MFNTTERKEHRVDSRFRATQRLPILSIIVPVHNGGELLHQCLAHLAAARPSESELIVVADGESDGAWRIAPEFGARVICLPDQQGPAAARNRGAQEARGDLLLFIDADVLVHPETCALIVAAFVDSSDLAAVIGSYDDAPTAKNFLSQYKNLFHHYVHQHAHGQASTFWGACGAIRKEIFLAHGGFAEHYRQPSVEDIELGYRLIRAGEKIRLLKDVQVTHLKRWGLYSLLKTDTFSRALPWTDLILRSGSIPNDLNLRWTSRVSTLLVYVLAVLLLAGSGSPVLSTLAGGTILTLLVLNAALYGFFWRKRGGWFTLRAIPWHWFYYAYSGLAFGVGIVVFLLRKRQFLPSPQTTETVHVARSSPAPEWRG